MSKMIKGVISILLCLTIVLQFNVFSSAVSNELASVEIKGNILTATLYDEDLTADKKFVYDLSSDENVATAYWEIIFTDGNYVFSVGTFLWNFLFSSKIDKLTFNQGQHVFGWAQIADGRLTHFVSSASVSAHIDGHTITWVCDLSNCKIDGKPLSIDGNSLSILNDQIHYSEYNTPTKHIALNQNWQAEYISSSTIGAYFKDVSDQPKYTKKAVSCPSDANKDKFVDALLANELGSIKGTNKEKEIKQKIYDLLFVAQYRPTEFGATKKTIQSWPYQNQSSNYHGGNTVYDSGLNKTVKWTNTYSKGCCAYARFASQYVNNSEGAYSKDKLVTISDNVKGASDIKKLILNYADPGEPIHYYSGN